MVRKQSVVERRAAICLSEICVLSLDCALHIQAVTPCISKRHHPHCSRYRIVQWAIWVAVCGSSDCFVHHKLTRSELHGTQMHQICEALKGLCWPQTYSCTQVCHWCCTSTIWTEVLSLGSVGSYNYNKIFCFCTYFSGKVVYNACQFLNCIWDVPSKKLGGYHYLLFE